MIFKGLLSSRQVLEQMTLFARTGLHDRNGAHRSKWLWPHSFAVPVLEPRLPSMHIRIHTDYILCIPDAKPIQLQQQKRKTVPGEVVAEYLALSKRFSGRLTLVCRLLSTEHTMLFLWRFS
jgi:hypothetical protein